MKYFKKRDETFIENGPALLRVGEIARRPSPFYSDRTIRIFDVLEVRRKGDKPIERGNRLAFSFPNDAMLAPAYTWYKDGKWEESQVPVTIADPPKPVAREMKRFEGKNPHE